MVFNKRAAVKTLSWRAISTTTTAVAVLLLTGNLAAAGIIGIIDTTLKTFLFYGHEHLWSKSDYGRDLRPSEVTPSYGSEDG